MRPKTANRKVCINPYCICLVKRLTTKYCSRSCFRSDPFRKITTTKGYKQSKETIEKRIRNTDQKSKERKRRSTLKERYGFEHTSQLPHVRDLISKNGKGRKQPRVEGQQEKIIESKRRNGTLNHTKETKEKLSKSIRDFHKNNPDFNKEVFLKSKSPKGYSNGEISGVFYRSSYEKMFLLFCDHYNIKVESAEKMKYSVNYTDKEGKVRRYFPDFYLPDSNTVVEIKPTSMLDFNNNDLKIEQGLREIENYIILTELDGFLYEKEWEGFYESSFKYLR